MLVVCFALLDWGCEVMLSFAYEEDEKESESDETHVRQEESLRLFLSVPVWLRLKQIRGPLMKI